MRITILTTGSRGDTQPYLALGLALKAQGHAVRVAAFENFGDFIKGYGLDYFPIQGDVTQAAAQLAGQDAMQADNPLKVLFSFSKLQGLVFDLQKDFYRACEGAEAVIYHPGAAIGFFAAQELGIPAILATPFPMSATGAYPALIFYNGPRLGKAYNRLTHAIFEQIMWMASAGPIKRFWKEKFGRAPAHFNSPFSRQNSSSQPTLISCSPSVFPRPDDWSEHIHASGYWFLDDEASWQPPADLLRFLENGKPPVYVGFGSVGSGAKAQETSALVLAALRKSGQRGLLATGWNGLAGLETPPEDIYVLESAPHSWLFPRMAAVVHHGGAGTTAAGLRAGVPSILIPFSNDQFAWGQRVQELGVGPRAIPRKQLSAEKLALAIQSALEEKTRSAAARLGEQIRAEHGAEDAAKVITDCLKRRR